MISKITMEKITMDEAELQALDVEAVKAIANDLGVKFHHKHNKDKIIAAVLSALDGAPPADDEGDALDEVLAEPAQPPSVAKMIKERQAAPAPAPAPVQVVTEPGKLQLQAQIRKEISEWPTVDEAKAALQPYVARGLSIVNLTDDYFHIRRGAKEASGNLKMPLKQLLFQANMLMSAAIAPTEE